MDEEQKRLLDQVKTVRRVTGKDIPKGITLVEITIPICAASHVPNYAWDQDIPRLREIIAEQLTSVVEQMVIKDSREVLQKIDETLVFHYEHTGRPFPKLLRTHLDKLKDNLDVGSFDASRIPTKTKILK